MGTSVTLTLGGSSLMGMVNSTSDPSEQIENAYLGHLGGGVVLGVLPKKICLLYPTRSVITYLPYAKPNLCNMWSWTTLGTQTHKPFVRVYTSADSFAPRLSAPRQKQDMWAEAQLLPDNISYSNLCRR